ncbi:PadR family transcriptional regulator [Actinomadura sp. NEAU-AAG7]|uniref:PadR family transcriptional regulator n=1 Tax=Actinomadura sp. NEAU-AAG7 TaxID=2839640 RepID=UPI001BE4A379|nr:PadR family transcriptional regulator [Actinomadura sp. NEAU-AAG7]MBT2209328.1 PadR family transcriptional regulator [Actinomadura sp. NEAU-AAG7]
MSLRHGLLGLLAEGPASGYDLARRFSEALGLVWPARHPQIYLELNRLESAGLIEVDSHGPRGRKAYRITGEGRAEVRRWLTEVDVDHTFRMETLFRSYFFWLMDADDLAAHLASEEEFYGELAHRLRGYAEGKDRGEWGTGRQARAMRIALEAGIRVNEALADWARWARETDPMTAEDFGVPKPADGE